MTSRSSSAAFRALFYFRNGWSLYFAFIFAAINTLTVTYFLAIDKIPLLQIIFPSFLNYVVIVSLIGIPLLILIGYIHYKRSATYKSEASILYESNPFLRRNLINSELTLEVNIKILELLLKLSKSEKLSDQDISMINKSKEELDRFVNDRTMKDSSDLKYMKKMMDK